MTPTATTEAPRDLMSYDEIAPLDWFQWRCLLWDYLPSCASALSWQQIAQAVNAQCRYSVPLEAETLVRAYEVLRRRYPECDSADPATGMRVWTRSLYGQVPRLMGGTMPPFLNLGYDGSPRVQVDAADEPFRLSIQLYETVLSGISLAGRDVIEIGCGTGGGCEWLHRRHRPATLRGADLLEDNIAECRRRCPPEVEFAVCDAESLDAPSSSYDVAVSIESSGHYPSMQRFVREVRRVLRPGGCLLLADLRPASDEWGPGRGLPDLFRCLIAAGLTVTRAANISEGVLRSIDAQEEGRQQFLHWTGVSGNMLSHLREILLTRDSLNYRLLRNGNLQYWSLACQV